MAKNVKVSEANEFSAFIEAIFELRDKCQTYEVFRYRVHELGRQIEEGRKPWSERSMKSFYRLLDAIPFVQYPVYVPVSSSASLPVLSPASA